MDYSPIPNKEKWETLKERFPERTQLMLNYLIDEIDSLWGYVEHPEYYTKIFDTPLPLAIKCKLGRYSIYDLGMLREFSAEDLLHLNGVGTKTVRVIEEYIETIGLQLCSEKGKGIRSTPAEVNWKDF